jgi:hypothetical protein
MIFGKIKLRELDSSDFLIVRLMQNSCEFDPGARVTENPGGGQHVSSLIELWDIQNLHMCTLEGLYLDTEFQPDKMSIVPTN